MGAFQIQKNDLALILEKMEMLSYFSEGSLDELSKLAEIVNYRKGEILLKQGQKNDDFYILIEGIVKVDVDGLPVAELSGPGNGIGEMSLVSNKPVSATITAVKDCQVLRMNGSLLSGREENKNYKMLFHYHSFFSVMLSEKLKKTNNKAKHFEDLNKKLELYKSEIEEINRDLEKKVQLRTQELELRSLELLKINSTLEQQKTALLVSKKQIEDLYSDRDFTFKRLDQLYQTSLIPLSEGLGEIQKKELPKEFEQIPHVYQSVLKTIEFIKPISSYYRAEKSMALQKILLVDSHKKQQIIARTALGGTGALLDCAESIEEALSLVSKQDYHIVFIDSEQSELIPYLADKSPRPQLVLMTSSPIREYLDSVLNCKVFPNILSRSRNSRASAAKSIMTTVTKLASGDLFGLNRYLTWGAEVLESTVVRSSDRKKIIEEMVHYFNSLGIRSSILSRCEVVAEELLMNAIYDAPMDSQGKSIYNQFDRRIEIVLKLQEQSRIRYATDGSILALSVEDPFGGLKGEVVLQYLKSCYEGRAGEFNKNKGGAGRGLHQIVEHSDLIIFNVKPGVKTEVIALFYLDQKAEEENYPSFHYFTE